MNTREMANTLQTLFAELVDTSPAIGRLLDGLVTERLQDIAPTLAVRLGGPGRQPTMRQHDFGARAALVELDRDDGRLVIGMHRLPRKGEPLRPLDQQILTSVLD